MFWKIVFLIGIAFIVFIVGTTVYFNFIDKPGAAVDLEVPCLDDASHSFYINNTGGLVYSTDFEQHGDIVGARIFILHGFWELRGGKFQKVDGDISLDERIFGEITVKKRTKD